MRSWMLYCLLVVPGTLARAWAQDLPSFELATIKPSGPGSPPASIQVLAGGRLVTANTPLSMLVPWAFNVDDTRIVGFPREASARFDIVAQAPGGQFARGEVYLMTRRLLAERFRLAVHRETRQLTTYTLAADAGGPKMTVVPPEPAGPNPFRMSAAGVLEGTRVTADMLATVLASQLGRPVANATGIMGMFDFTLQWQPDDRPASSDRPSLSTALREQLGLRLVAQSSPVEVVVIDRLETTPTAD
jgi:uncharacterized protein (TIGR03435 family)